MDDAGLSQIPESLAELTASTEDIPEAVRETPVVESPSSLKRTTLLWSLGGLVAIALLALPLIFAFRPQAGSNATQPVRSADASQNNQAAQNAENGEDQATSSSEEGASEALLGHLPYEEAPASELEPITPDGGISLHKTAAEKFLQMVDAAQADGVSLVPLSGFRSVKEQEQIFFELKAERGEVTTSRATVSAPPGYSEHHTGYAVDIGDGNAPATNLQFDFEETQAFQWLKENAAFYSFELSFTKNNPMGVSYEPWHWRFVGDRRSLETFYRAEQLNPQSRQATGQPEEEQGQQQEPQESQEKQGTQGR